MSAAHLWRRLFSPVNGAEIDYLSSRHLGALIESSDPLAAIGGISTEVAFFFTPRSRADEATHPDDVGVVRGQIPSKSRYASKAQSVSRAVQ